MKRRDQKILLGAGSNMICKIKWLIFFLLIFSTGAFSSLAQTSRDVHHTIKAEDTADTHGNLSAGNKYGLNEDAISQKFKVRLQEIKNKMKSGSLDKKGKRILSKQLDIIHGKLASTEKALADRVRVLAEIEKVLESEELKSIFSENQLQDAQEKLEKGDSSQAEALFIQLLGEAKPNIKPEAAYLLGRLTYDRVDLRAARNYLDRALQLAPQNSRYLNHAGYLADNLDNFDKAIEYFEKALQADLKTFGPEHQDVANDWNNLGEGWRKKGQYDKAIEYYKKAQDINLKTVGEIHPNVATTWENLGHAQYSKGQYAKAIEYYEKALASDLKSFGPEHPQVAFRWNHLGEGWRKKGQKDANNEHRKNMLELESAAKAIASGHDNAEFPLRWDQLSQTQNSNGKFTKSIEYFEKALQSDLKTFGPENPNISRDWKNLGLAWFSIGLDSKATENYQKALVRVQNNLDKKNQGQLDVPIRWDKLGEPKNSIGQFKKAIEYYQKALDSGIKIFGPEHPNVAKEWNNLGLAWWNYGNNTEAIGYFEIALASDIKTFGKNHPEVATGWNNLGAVWLTKGNQDKAIEYYEKAFTIYEKANLPHKAKVVKGNLADLKN